MPTKFLELALIALALSPLALHKPLVRLFRGLGTGYRVVIAALVLCVIGGHATSFNTFPFVKWNMYGWPPGGDPVVYEYTGILKSGNHVQLVPSRLMSSMTADRIMSKLARLLSALEPTAGTDAQNELRLQHDDTIIALARLYNCNFPADPMEHVDVSRNTIHLRPKNDEYITGPEVLWRVTLPPREP